MQPWAAKTNIVHPKAQKQQKLRRKFVLSQAFERIQSSWMFVYVCICLYHNTEDVTCFLHVFVLNGFLG